MFKMTKGDLAKKTDAQLAALFQEASEGIAATKPDIAKPKLNSASGTRRERELVSI